MTVKDLLNSEFCIGKAFVFFLVYVVKQNMATKQKIYCGLWFLYKKYATAKVINSNLRL